MDFKSYVRNVGENIRLHRENKNMSRKDLYNVINISVQHIGRIERGEANPSLEVLHKIANALDTSIPALLGDYSDKLGSLLKKYKFSNKYDIYKLLIAFDNLNKNQIDLVIKMIAGIKN